MEIIYSYEFFQKVLPFANVIVINSKESICEYKGVYFHSSIAGYFVIINNPEDRYWHNLHGPAYLNRNGINGHYINNEFFLKTEWEKHPLVIGVRLGTLIAEVMNEQ